MADQKQPRKGINRQTPDPDQWGKSGDSHQSMAGAYNTRLTPAQETGYSKLYGPEDSYDYDMRGAYKAAAEQARNGHYPDTFKKPNHPTFSNESKYANKTTVGGNWKDNPDKTYTFEASRLNTNNMDKEKMGKYFKRVEPGNKIKFPPK